VTHLVVSVGGNDALGYSGVLNLGTPTIAEALLRLASVSAEFEDSYAAMLDGLSATGLRLAVCTIYDPAYPDAVRQRAAATALKVLNDPILRLAAERGLPVIELRLVCRSPEDYANPIEPSVQGGRRIAAAIAGLLRHHAFETGRSTIYL
jgi:hypothetical protein